MYNMARDDVKQRYVTDDRIDIIQDEPKKSKENYNYE